MKLGYTKKVNLTIGLSFFMGPLAILVMFLRPEILAHPILVWAMFLIGQILFVGGCCLYASGKGQHPALGLLGLLWIPGLVILAFFTDKHKGEDPDNGCLYALLIFLLFLAMVLGPVAYFVIKAGKTAKGVRTHSQEPDRLEASIARVSVVILKSPSSDLASRIKSVDTLLRLKETGRQKLIEVLAELKQKPAPTKDDEMIMRHIEVSLQTPVRSGSRTDSGVLTSPFEEPVTSSASARGVKIVKIALTTGLDASSLPVSDVNQISMADKNVYVHVTMEMIPQRKYQFVGALYDGTGKRILNYSTPMTPDKTIWRAWIYHTFESTDSPGRWKYVITLDGIPYGENEFEVTK